MSFLPGFLNPSEVLSQRRPVAWPEGNLGRQNDSNRSKKKARKKIAKASRRRNRRVSAQNRALG